MKLTYAMLHMVAVTTDGASSNVEPVQGAQTFLRRKIMEMTRSTSSPRTEILPVCYAHKLDLIMKALHHPGYNLARAIVVELHNIFGSTSRAIAGRFYPETAKAMCFAPLQMNALFEVRWSESLAVSLNNTVRMYPVLLQTLKRPKDDPSVPSLTKKRAAIAHYVLGDMRTFLSLYHLCSLRNVEELEGRSVRFAYGFTMARTELLQIVEEAQNELFNDG
ncbi:hypothetical protein Aduo_002299 [Ancylostoma duodenale]